MWQTVSSHWRTNRRAKVTATVTVRTAKRAAGLQMARPASRPNRDAARTEPDLRFMRGLLEGFFGE